LASCGEASRFSPGEHRTRLEQWFETDVLLWFGERILPVTKDIADRWGTLDATCQLRGTPANTADGMIAATALEHGLTVVTRKVKDFARLGAARRATAAGNREARLLGRRVFLLCYLHSKWQNSARSPPLSNRFIPGTPMTSFTSIGDINGS
jgi:predicted nucleic acid-binding protein